MQESNQDCRIMEKQSERHRETKTESKEGGGAFVDLHRYTCATNIILRKKESMSNNLKTRKFLVYESSSVHAGKGTPSTFN